MDAYVIRGGRPLEGVIRPQGNKNAALPMLAAALLSGDTVELENVPAIRDVETMVELVASVGAEVARDGERVTVRAADLSTDEPPDALCRQIRASFLLAGPLLGRRGRAVLPRPGGDRIGRRPLDTHIHALRELGVETEIGPGRYVLTAPRGLRGADVFLHETSVMATENTLMAAALAEGRTTIHNAASEPHVQDLCRMLVAAGVPIEGIGTNRLTVTGVREIGPVRARVGVDHIEVGSLIALAALAGGEVRIAGGRLPADDRMIRIAFGKLGISWEVDGEDLVVPAGQDLAVREDLHGSIPRIEDAPWPGFPADLTSIAVVAATQARGTILVHEKMFESRLFWVDRLIAMGARIVLCDPHRAVIVGPSALHGQVLTSPDIRAGMAMLIAALCARGESRIFNIAQIERGYERLDERLGALGARIERRTDLEP
ncbi:MAG: UDP-N-acetylglucosamine 1-carboxyvinyltransferase [Acidobacteria bacterium]|nr:MAG: UDP-N-acetylglucosamine 1-carboxyvinyltransferase [Acidobacteriota bacterium]